MTDRPLVIVALLIGLIVLLVVVAMRRGLLSSRVAAVPAPPARVSLRRPRASRPPRGLYRAVRRLARLRFRLRPAPDQDRLTAPLIISDQHLDLPEPGLGAGALVGCTGHSAWFRGGCTPREPAAGLVVRGAVLRGLSHAVDGTVGQDASGALWHQRSGSLYLAVADGVGSLPDSARAAYTAVRSVLQEAPARPGHVNLAEHAPQLFARVGQAVSGSLPGGETGAPTGATTLLLAEIRPVLGGALAVVCGVGDSEAWLLDGDGWRPIHHERDGGGEENSTRQLPRHPEPKTYSFEVASGSVVLLATDGFAGAIGTRRSPLARELQHRWTSVPTPLEFVTHVDFVDEYWIDDRTAVAVWVR
ncbi:protein phosphatase 2C domain-containing protein [Dactylosporangium vinaceum]|uniref:Protein phosphatase 2C domain-containing protein n=1 Tax=Dactylosporangium vinaceum TaxID=53362 RepID=A0ABV5M0C9_9ACTN|nr:protein phosphatase 2C domain-containing protein [Dactylosporangium vinaceum]UAB97409.1 protein phosphatase 2C domain-containing protein [Dactylosporangium vinaceum]